MKTVAVIGCGVIGGSWALVFARAGFTVRLYDPAPGAIGAALALAAAGAELLAAHGQLNGETPASVVTRLVPAATLSNAVQGVDYIQESAPERLEVKQALYRELATCVPPACIIGSSTSGLPVSRFTETLPYRENCLVVHPVNPPHLIPLVELVPAPWTSNAAIDAAAALMREVGQTPIRLRREIAGFVVNRLQSAVLAEAFRLVEDGICTATDVDNAMADGLGPRWAFMGPFETIDLNAQGGIADYCTKLGPMYFEIAKSQADPRSWSTALVARIEAECRQK